MRILKKWFEEQSYHDMLAHYEKLPRSKENVLVLSTLFRLTDQYEAERKLVEELIRSYSNWEYLRARLKWHEQKEFDKLVPRPPFRRKQDSGAVPSQEDLEKLIIVTGGDASYFPWIIETIESVRTGGIFKDVHIGVVDCGLQEDQRDYIRRICGDVTIKDPGYDFAGPDKLEQSWKCGIPETNLDAFKTITSRAFLDKHFPGYFYYFWIDSDAWVQDESAIYDYILLAKKQKIGMSENNMAQHVQETIFYNDVYMTPDMQRAIHPEDRATCAGVVCLTPDFLDKWRPVVLELYKAKAIVNNSPSIYYTIHKYLKNPAFLPHRYQFSFRREGLPLVDNNQVLYGAKSKQPCGIIHLNGLYGVREKHRYFPTRSLDDSVNIDEHINRSWKAITDCKNDPNIDPLRLKIFQNQKHFSMRYRVWPWREKEVLRDKLKQILQKPGGGVHE